MRGVSLQSAHARTLVLMLSLCSCRSRARTGMRVKLCCIFGFQGHGAGQV